MRIQLRPLASEPRETEQGQQRMAEGRGAERNSPLERDRDAEPRERGLERNAHRVERRADDRDLLGRGSATDRGERLLCHELERPARAGTLEKADRAVER